MSFFSQPKEHAEGNLSLNDVLNTPTLRTELVAITALCSDTMRRDVLIIFKPITEPLDPGQDTHAMELQNESVLERIDLQSTQTQELRRAAMTYFDKWQVDVLRRLGDVLSVKPDAVRMARADAKRNAELATKARRDKEYWAWANGLDTKPEDVVDTDITQKMKILPEGFQAKILQLPEDKRILILDSVLLALLSLEKYTAHSRILMLKLTSVFQLPESILIDCESKVAEGLLASAAAKMCADESTARQASEDAAARRWKIGLATVAGAALIGVTGGLAAPILAGGIGSIMGGLGLGAVASLLGPLATNMVLVGGLFGAFGGRMTGNIMEKYAQEIKDFKFLPVSSNNAAFHDPETLPADEQVSLSQLQDESTRKSHKLRVAIGISGSITDPLDFVEPWKVFSGSKIEAFGLRWEMDALMQLGRKISEVLESFAWDFAKFQLLSMVLAGLWPFGLLRAASMLDSPFAIAKTRSDKAGKVLADVIMNKVQGGRPVTLVGYGLGARVIYSCLLQLAEQNAFGLVESAVFLGGPTPSEASSWRRIRTVVTGRVVNVYSSEDFVLGFLYRSTSAQLGIAGLQQIRGVCGVENFDFTDIIKGHDKYRHLVGTILQRIGIADIDIDVLREHEQRYKQLEDCENATENLLLSQSEQDLDNSLAKEDEHGRIVLVNNERQDLPVHREYDKDNKPKKASVHLGSQMVDDYHDEQEESSPPIRMEDNDAPLSVLAPDPEPDCGPDRETVRFGSAVRGFTVEWDSSTT